MDYAFTCTCKCLFARYIRGNDEVKADCPLCGATVTDASSMSRDVRVTNRNIIQDIEPYRSPIDRSVVTSRSRHRDHMREHGVVEMGNEYPKERKAEPAPMPRAATDIKRVLQQAGTIG
jgi:hypothetical protein